MPFLQDVIHKLEVGGGMRYVRLSLAALAVLLLLFGYNIRAFRNMSTQEAMDSAQLARNISRGEGFTTRFIRPLSIWLVKKHNMSEGVSGAQGQDAVAKDYALLKTGHPDVSNAPVYPFVLAGLMKVLPFSFETSGKGGFWNPGGFFLRYQPDFLIGIFNQLIYLAVIILLFLLARRLFDQTVAWVSAVILLAAEVFWRFSVSGLSTVLALFIFTCLVWLLVLFEDEAREGQRGVKWLLLLAAGIGLTVGLLGLTRYALLAVIVPVAFYMAVYGGTRKVPAVLLTLAVFAAVVIPWLLRTYSITGTLFGTAQYTVMETTPNYGEFRLQRSLEPDMQTFFRSVTFYFWHKLLVNGREILQSDLPRLGSSWVSAFFLVGLLMSFMNPGTRRLRHFIIGSLLVLIVAQAVGHTHLSVVSPDINSENLIVLMLPLIVVYGVSVFFVLLEQINLPLLEIRYLVMGLFVVVASLPMVFVFLPPAPYAIAYPPYDPPAIQTISRWMKGVQPTTTASTNSPVAQVGPEELMMSDIPWAVAWYGDRQCVWLTLHLLPDPTNPEGNENFFAINDYLKPVQALYLTPVTIDRRFISEWFKAGEYSWGSFILQSFVEKRVPKVFPLGHAALLPYVPLQADTPQKVEKRLSILDKQIADLADAAKRLGANPNLAPVIQQTPEVAGLLRDVITYSEGRDFPLGSAPVRDMRGLESLIMRGQLFLTDKPRWQ